MGLGGRSAFSEKRCVPFLLPVGRCDEVRSDPILKRTVVPCRSQKRFELMASNDPLEAGQPDSSQ
jgi:hypothetical protein